MDASSVRLQIEMGNGELREVSVFWIDNLLLGSQYSQRRRYSAPWMMSPGADGLESLTDTPRIREVRPSTSQLAYLAYVL